jgi:hypothetical protein
LAVFRSNPLLQSSELLYLKNVGIGFLWNISYVLSDYTASHPRTIVPWFDHVFLKFPCFIHHVVISWWFSGQGLCMLCLVLYIWIL